MSDDIRPNQTITPIPDNQPDALPELWNFRYRQIDENEAALEDSLKGAISGLGEQANRITAIENESAGSVTQALRLDWQYSSQTQIALELFYDSWTLLPGLTNVVTSAVAGDDSLDLNTVAGLKAGDEYVVFDDENQERVVLSTLLTETRARTTTNLTHSYTNAKLRKTSWALPGGKAVATGGGIYIATGLNLGNELADKALVIRREDNDLQLAVYYQDDRQTEWAEAAWSWKRDVEDGVIDVEYLLPVRGIFNVMVIATAGEVSSEADINHMAVLDQETGLEGSHNPPDTPSIVSPADGATDIDEQPSITTSAYSHPAGTPMQGIRVQISTAPDMAEGSIVADSGLIDGISWAPEKGILSTDTVYYAWVLHMDEERGISVWSEVISFTTASSFVTVLKPSITSPTSGAEISSPNGITLTSSAFDTEGGTDTHANSRWKIALDPAMTDIVVDSGVDDTNLTSYDVADDILERGETYYCQVWHEGTAEGWADGSTVVSFSIAEFSAFVSSFGGNGNGYFYDVKIDDAGNFYAAGYEGISTGTNFQALLAKFDAEGNPLWQKKLGGNYDSYFHSVDIDDSGAIYAGGGEKISDSSNHMRGLLAKFTSEGALTWQKSIGGSTNSDVFNDIAIDSSGNILAAGSSYDVTKNPLLVKFSTAGAVTWQLNMDGNYHEEFKSVDVDGSDNVYAAGSAYTADNGQDAFLAKFSSAGSPIWQKRFGGNDTSADEFQGLLTDPDGYSYCVGNERSSSSNTNTNMIVSKFSPEGNIAWQKGLGGDVTDVLYGICMDSSGNICVVGREGSSHTNDAAFIAKISSAGDPVWQKGIHGGDNAWFYGVAVNIDGTFCAVGYERSTNGWNQAFMATIAGDAGGAVGTIPDLPSLSWIEPGLTPSTPVLSAPATSFSVADPSLTLTSPGLTLSTTTLTHILSAY